MPFTSHMTNDSLPPPRHGTRTPYPFYSPLPRIWNLRLFHPPSRPGTCKSYQLDLGYLPPQMMLTSSGSHRSGRYASYWQLLYLHTWRTLTVAMSFFACFFILFAFSPTFVWCEKALTYFMADMKLQPKFWYDMMIWWCCPLRQMCLYAGPLYETLFSQKNKINYIHSTWMNLPYFPFVIEIVKFTAYS